MLSFLFMVPRHTNSHGAGARAFPNTDIRSLEVYTYTYTYICVQLKSIRLVNKCYDQTTFLVDVRDSRPQPLTSWLKPWKRPIKPSLLLTIFKDTVAVTHAAPLNTNSNRTAIRRASPLVEVERSKYSIPAAVIMRLGQLESVSRSSKINPGLISFFQ